MENYITIEDLKDFEVWKSWRNGGGLELKPKEEWDYLEGFINQFIGEEAELSNDDWTVSDFLEWLKLNKFKIVKIN